MNYSRALRIIRDSKKLTQKELADFANVTPGYISKIEKGERVPTLEVLEKICDKTNIPLTLLTLIASSKEHFDANIINDLEHIQTSLLGLLNDSNDHPTHQA
jgi:transcriptional regulator with XRE-family HTH domain